MSWLKSLFGRRRERTDARELLEAHFDPTPLEALSVHERTFPYRMRADLQTALESAVPTLGEVTRFTGVQVENHYEGITFGSIAGSQYSKTMPVAPQYEEVDIGDDHPVRCMKNGLWLVGRGERRLAVLLSPKMTSYQVTGWAIQIAVPGGGDAVIAPFLESLERAVSTSACYRGKILSLEQSEENYSGRAVGVRVHTLREVLRDQVILPPGTLELLERNVIQFVKQRPQLAALGMPTRKGVLFYGPPGTGKTHTIHYLARALEGHTTLLISAEQLAHLADYMTLARLLSPSIVVMEDVDLIARERTRMGSPCEEALLNKLLNEMDGLRPDADVLFVLTTNRPQELESALSARPGRIDQAIEFPLPDDDGRRKLVRLYAGTARLDDATVGEVVRRTDRVSAAFIKELMRRAAQFQISRNGDGTLEVRDVEEALQEMLFRGGSLNLKLLGAEARLSTVP